MDSLLADGWKAGKSVSDTAFNLGKAAAKLTTTAFRADTGLRDLINAERVLKTNENMGADQARAITEMLYDLTKGASKEMGVTPEQYLKTLGNVFEGIVNPDELLAAF